MKQKTQRKREKWKQNEHLFCGRTNNSNWAEKYWRKSNRPVKMETPTDGIWTKKNIHFRWEMRNERRLIYDNSTILLWQIRFVCFCIEHTRSHDNVRDIWLHKDSLHSTKWHSNGNSSSCARVIRCRVRCAVTISRLDQGLIYGDAIDFRFMLCFPLGKIYQLPLPWTQWRLCRVLTYLFGVRRNVNFGIFHFFSLSLVLSTPTMNFFITETTNKCSFD